MPDKSRKRKRTGKHEEVESALGEWFSAVRNKKQTVTGPMLMEKSKDFAERLGSDFTPSTGWLARWKNRMGIKFKRAHGEKSSADEEAAENWLLNKLPTLLEEFSETDIFNADETGLFYRATPDSSLCFAKEQLSGSKKALERITVLVCANMAGTEKKKLLVIGKSKNPRCFKGLDVGKLPVTYKWNTKAWMTGIIFTEWISEWDKELRLAGRRILLLVDNCSAHPALEMLTNIRLEFLPPNTTSMIQPMDQGVIRNLKVHYRKELINLTLSHIEEGLLLPTATATDVSSKVNVFDAIQFISKSWRQVQPLTISNCFRKAGFQKSEATDTAEIETDETEDEAEAFLAIQGEADMACRGGEATEDEIVEAVQEKKRQKIDGEECPADEEERQEDDDDEEDDRHVSAAEAKKALATLCRFATASDFTPETLHKLDDVGAAVHKAALASMVQPDITRFFHPQPHCSTSH